MLGLWTLDTIEWDKFDASKVDAETLAAVKAASLVEINAADYVDYLSKVFSDDAEMLEAIRQWGQEEIQHGQALGRWAEMADPTFNLEDAFRRFRAGYKINEGADQSVRGSRAGELVARCVVESGTSTFYMGIRDEIQEPVLRQIAGLISADEFRHYRLFYEGFLKYEPVDGPNRFRRLSIAFTRMKEAEDDELAYAYYCGNVLEQDEANTPYVRSKYSKAYSAGVLRFYRREHLRKAVAMVSKAGGLKPTGFLSRAIARIAWWVFTFRSPQKAQAA